MTVTHDEAGRQFVVHTPDGDATLKYELPDATTIDLQHTRVPEPERGHGVAAALAEAGFAFARANHLKVIPTCRFVLAWLERHPDQSDIVRS